MSTDRDDPDNENDSQGPPDRTVVDAMLPVKTARGAITMFRADEAFALRLQGLSYEQISKRLNLSAGVVYRAVSERLQRNAERMANTTGVQLLQQELERLDHMFSVAWSRGTGSMITDPNTGEPVRDERTGEIKHYDPDPRWLLRAEAILKQRADMLGITKERIEITGANGGPIAVAPMDLSTMTPSQIAMLEVLLDRAGMKGVARDATVIDAEVISDAPADPSEPDEGEDEP